MGWGFGFDYRLDMAVFGMETTKEVEDLVWLGDRIANVAQIVGEVLELGAVVSDGTCHLAGCRGIQPPG